MRGRAALAAPGAAAGGWGWLELGRPGHAGGLAAAVGLALAVWPLVVLAVVFGIPAALVSVIPWRWRRAWRHRHAYRPHIPNRVRRAVYAADRHRCLWCGGDLDGLQLDHVRPWSLGGLSSLWNLVTLCGPCNRVKSNFWRFRSGHVVYRAWEGSADAITAAAILAVEKRARCNPARWWRAAWSLAA